MSAMKPDMRLAGICACSVETHLWSSVAQSGPTCRMPSKAAAARRRAHRDHAIPRYIPRPSTKHGGDAARHPQARCVSSGLLIRSVKVPAKVGRRQLARRTRLATADLLSFASVELEHTGAGERVRAYQLRHNPSNRVAKVVVRASVFGAAHRGAHARTLAASALTTALPVLPAAPMTRIIATWPSARTDGSD